VEGSAVPAGRAHCASFFHLKSNYRFRLKSINVGCGFRAAIVPLLRVIGVMTQKFSTTENLEIQWVKSGSLIPAHASQLAH